MPTRAEVTRKKTDSGRLSRLLGIATLDVTPLRASRNYRLLYTAQFVAAFGASISYVVLPWQMFQLTNSTAMVGAIGLAEFLPMFALALVGGALADAVDRRKLIVFAECGMALCCLSLTVNAVQAQPRVWFLFVAASVFAALNGLMRPALEALTPRLVAAEHLPAVSTLSMFRSSLSQIVGPAIAGIIVAQLGSAVGFALDFTTSAVAIGVLMRMSSVPLPKNTAQPGLGSVVEGLRYARTRPELLGTYLIDINAMFFAMPVALFPALAREFGGASVGYFYSTMAFGALLMALTSGWTKRIQRHGLGVIGAVVVWGLAIVGFGLAGQLWLALAFLLVASAADAVSGIFRQTIWNQTIPDRLRGRLAGLEMISYLTGPYLGNVQVGFTASRLGLRRGITWGGAVCVVGAGLTALLLPGFRRYHAREGLARREAEAGSDLPV